MRAVVKPQTQQTYYVAYFEMTNLPEGTTEVHVQSIIDALSGKPTPLNFTLPVHQP
ncbi:hypothetical protein EI42_03673 [Thermosporothrix hazakensis]|jgi:hypothetical protein|uniref:Uncharacterized protein n=2 Tax=Thermosporothrix TaxID=768650 RepID=A0A326U4Q5_THEHA|nr:hypothetical protein EI42_03673 [Thermosporothrix hazakensis]BBH87980.1 hypothetical protein KTC_27310 [Thermosporothrix sp. COM3]GCE50394.1 hypothetical protein KTH_52630 [Thermosporothrix hazakensis]